MNRKMIRLAFGLKCGGLAASGCAAPAPAGPRGGLSEHAGERQVAETRAGGPEHLASGERRCDSIVKQTCDSPWKDTSLVIADTSPDVAELGRAEERLRKREPGFGAGIACSNDGLDDRLSRLVDLVRVLRLWLRLRRRGRLDGAVRRCGSAAARGIQLGLGRLDTPPGTPGSARPRLPSANGPSTTR